MTPYVLEVLYRVQTILLKSGEKCSVCMHDDGCKPTGGYLEKINELSQEDWSDIMDFFQYVQIPYIHGIIARVRARKENLGRMP